MPCAIPILVNRWRQIVAALLLTLTTAPALAATFLHIESSPGDGIGGGQTRHFANTFATFTATCTDHMAAVEVAGIDPATGAWESWTTEFAAPTASPLTVEVYEQAYGLGTQPATKPGMNIHGASRGCVTISGRFVVREFACSSSGVVERLAIDAEQHCGPDSIPPLYAIVRINSEVPQVTSRPTASAGIDRIVTEGDTVYLDGSKSAAPAGIASITWRQTAGPTVNLSNSTSFNPTFVAPEVSAGGATIVLTVDVTDRDGLTDSNSMSVHVQDSADPRTFLTVEKRSNGSPTVDSPIRFDLENARLDQDCGRVLANIPSGPPWVELWFSNAFGKPLRPDVYEGAVGYVERPPERPTLNISGPEISCAGVQRRFIVREYECSNDGQLKRVAIDAEQRCEAESDRAAIFAYLRINSAIPERVAQPTASAGVDQQATTGELVQLDATRSYAPDGIATAAWRVVSGPAVTLSGSDGLTPSFIAPLTLPGGEAVELEVRITDPKGRSDTNTVKVMVYNVDEPRTRLVMVSHPRDWIGRGITRVFNDIDNHFSGLCSDFFAELTLVGDYRRVFSIGLSYGDQLVPGIYENASTTYGAPPGTPALRVYGDARTCRESYGRFVVHEIECRPDFQVVRLAVDAEQHCEDISAPPLYAFARFNSTRPIPQVDDRGCRLDVDGNGALSGSHDGAALLRGVAGLTRRALEGPLAPAAGATRSSYRDLEPYFQNTCAIQPSSVVSSQCSLDLDGDGKIQLTTDGVIATRVIAGLTGEAVIANALGVGATRTNWIQIAEYLAACQLIPPPR